MPVIQGHIADPVEPDPGQLEPACPDAVPIVDRPIDAAMARGDVTVIVVRQMPDDAPGEPSLTDALLRAVGASDFETASRISDKLREWRQRT